MATVVRRRAAKQEPARPTIDVEKARQFLVARRLASENDKIKDRLKKELDAFVAANGYTGPNGHQYVDLPEPIEGFHALQRRRTARKVVDDEVAERILTEIGALDECSVRVVVLDATRMPEIEETLKAAGLWDEVATVTHRLDDDKVTAYHAEHPDKLTKAHMDQILVEDVTWQFWPVEAVGE